MSAPQPGPPRTIYVQWSGDGQHIRKWSMAEFDLAERIIAETMSVSDPKAQALADALRDALGSMEYWAGCDEGCTADVASSEIMGSGGAWPSVAYDKATAALAAWDAKP